MPTSRLSRSFQFGQLFEYFFVSAVSSIIAIRLYLVVTGYPQLGGGQLHIAHMLWGGLLLVIALLGSLLFLNNDVKNVWAVLGGAGFGTFIDEIGKFITRDNNYFFQPTFAIIYVIFVCLYLLYRNIWFKQSFTQDEYLLNSVDELKEVVTKELDQEEIAKALEYVSRSDPHHPLTSLLKKTYQELKEFKPAKPSLYHQARSAFTTYYQTLIAKQWFLNLIIIFFVVRAGEYLVRGGAVIFDVFSQPFEVTLQQLVVLRGVLPLINVLGLLAQAVLTVVGVLLIRRAPLKAYRSFRTALLLSILVLQVFNYYQDPVLALFTTLRDVLILTVVEYMITKEKSSQLTT